MSTNSRQELVDVASTTLAIVQLVDERTSGEWPVSPVAINSALQGDPAYAEFGPWLLQHLTDNALGQPVDKRDLALLVADWLFETASIQQRTPFSPPVAHPPQRTKRPATARGLSPAVPACC